MLSIVVALACWTSVGAQDPPAEPAPVFAAETRLVVLHVSVQDGRGGFVRGLSREAFTVFDNGVREDISLFLAEDSPVTVGLLIDNSISMRENRASLIAAATEFADARHPEDELFALVFNEHVEDVLPGSAPFARDPATFRDALTTGIAARGRTALFDALDRGISYAARGSHPRRVLVVISDGGDNASRITFEDVLRRAQASNVAIYTVALIDPLDVSARPDRLKTLARETGGAAWRPRFRHEVPTILRNVAADIRRTYTVGYVPSRDADARYHALRVDVTLPTGRKPVVRTRAGYLAESARIP